VATYLYITQIIVAVALIGLVLIQARSGGLGGVFGGDSAVYRTRRGLERTLYHATIGLSLAFFLLAIASLFLTGS
jgi:preprotein translocase subunit SecG